MKVLYKSKPKLAMSKRFTASRPGWVVALGLVIMVTGPPRAVAQSTWIGAGGNAPLLWDNKNNWDVAPPVNGKVGYTLKFTGQNNAFVSSNNLAGNFEFSDIVLSTTFTGKNNGLTGQVIDGNPLKASASKTIPIPTVEQNGPGTFNILNNIELGAAGLKLAGTAGGTVNIGKATDATVGILSGGEKGPLVIDSSGNASFYLYGNNTYAGGTKLMAGTLVIGNSTDAKATASAIGTGDLTLSGGTIRAAEGLGAQSLSNAVTINGNTTVGASVTGLTVKDTLTLAGTITLAKNPILTFNALDPNRNSVETNFNGSISGKSNLTIQGPSSLTLGGTEANTYIGTTTVAQGTLQLDKAGVVAVPGPLVIGGLNSTAQTVKLLNNEQINDSAPVTMYKGAIFDLNGKTETIGSLSDAPKKVDERKIPSATVEIGAGTLTTGSAGSTVFSGKFTASDKGTLVKADNTTFTLTGNSDKFQGTLLVEGGTLVVGAGQVVENGKVVKPNTGQLGSNASKLQKVTVNKDAILTGSDMPKGSKEAKGLNIWAKKVDVKDGGVLKPGLAAAGIFGIGATLTMERGSHFEITLAGLTAGDGAGHYSQLQLVGGGTIQGSILDLSLAAVPVFNHSYTIIENLNSDFGTSDVTPLTGIFFDESGRALTNGSDIDATFGGESYEFAVNYNQGPSGYDVTLTDVTMSTVPEPPSSLLLTLGAAAVFAVAARRRSPDRGGALARLSYKSKRGLAMFKSFTASRSGGAVALGLAMMVIGPQRASAQSTWIGVGNNKLWSDKDNWNVPLPPNGDEGYTLNFTGQNNPFVSKNNRPLFKFDNIVLSTTFAGANGKFTGQVIDGFSLVATKSKANPIPTIQQNGTGTFNILNTIRMGDDGLKLTGTAGGTVIFGKVGDASLGLFTGRVSGKPLVIDSSGNASFYLYGQSAYDNGTKLLAGTLVIGSSTAEMTKDSAIGRGALTLSGGTIRAAEGQGAQSLSNSVTINGNTTFGAKVAGLTVKDTLTLTGPITLANNPILTFKAVDPAGTSVETNFSGAISGQPGFTKEGTSMLTLGGIDANTYSGTTTVAQGTLQLDKAGVVAVPGALVIGGLNSNGQTVKLLSNEQINDSAPVTMYKGAIFDLNGKTETIGSLGDAPNKPEERNRLGGTVEIGAGKLTTGSAGSTVFSGTLTANADGTLDKTGNTTFTLTSESKKFRGTLLVEGGTLNLAKGQLGDLNSKLKLVDVSKGAILTGAEGPGDGKLNIWADKVKVDSKGVMAPGAAAAGILGIGASLAMAPGSHLEITLAGLTAGDGAGHYSQLQLVGGGTIQGSILDLSLAAAPVFNHSYTIIENLNSDFGTSDVTPLTGIFFDESGRALTNGSDIDATFGGESYEFAVNYNQGPSGYDVTLTDVTMSTVPEPPSSLLLTLGAAAVFAVAARRRTVQRGNIRGLLCCVVIGLPVMDGTSARAGSILFTNERLEAIAFGDNALREGRLTGAALDFEKVADLASAPRWTAERRRGLELDCHRRNAAVAEGRRDWQAARAAFEDWLKLAPADSGARQRLGKALFGLGQQKEAFNELERAAALDATLEPAALTMGLLHARAGDSKKAGEWMEYAVQAAPGSPLAQLALASWMLEQGRADLAQAHADLAFQLDPKSSDARRLLGLVARVRRDFAKSELIFQVLADQSPGDVSLRNQLALVLAEQADQGKGRRALELVELSVRQDPEGPDTLATLADVYYRLQRLEDAEKLLQAVVDSGQASSDTAYTLALVKAGRGHPEVALALLKAALAAPGLFIHRDDARQWLDRLESSARK